LAGEWALTHLAGLTRDMVFVEALTRLGELPPRGAWFLFLPTAPGGGTGAPGRANGRAARAHGTRMKRAEIEMAEDPSGDGPATMSVVVTNDDGIDSPGLHRLAAAAAGTGRSVLVAAPDYEASGASASMAAVGVGDRIAIERRALPGLDGITGYAVRAAPAFIAFAAAQGGFGERPGLLLSGINRGANTGRAVLHSGTVGAALTAAMHRIPTAAFSLDCLPDGEQYWDTAAVVARQIIGVLGSISPGLALNVNVPNVPLADLRGIRYAQLADFGAVQIQITAAPQEHLELTMFAPPEPPQPDSDSAALAAGYASVTAVQAICEAPAASVPWPAGSDQA
jgi:5'-nucleotidase